MIGKFQKVLFDIVLIVMSIAVIALFIALPIVLIHTVGGASCSN